MGGGGHPNKIGPEFLNGGSTWELFKLYKSIFNLSVEKFLVVLVWHHSKEPLLAFFGL